MINRGICPLRTRGSKHEPSGPLANDGLPARRLSPADRQSVREEIFASEEAWSQLAAAEEELVDSYARGELDAEHRALVEERLLWSAAAQKKLRMARALLQAGSVLRRRRRMWAIASTAAAAVLLMASFVAWWRTPAPEVAPVVAALTIPLEAERGETTVPRIKLRPSGGRLHVELRLTTAEPATGGTARFLFREGERSYRASINGKLAVLELDRRDLHDGPCEIEVAATGRLVAAGSVVFTE